MDARSRRAVLAALALCAASCRSCIVVTDVVPSKYNGGALDSAGDPFRDKEVVRNSIVERVVFEEMIDGYFGQGSARSSYAVASWLRAANADEFLGLVRCLTDGEARRCRVSIPQDGSPTQAARQNAVEKGVGQITGEWTQRSADRPICTAPSNPDWAALERVVDEVRFNQAVARAARSAAEVLTEGLVDEDAVKSGALLAFGHAARYLEQRRWRRERDLPTTGLVVKGGAATGIYSAGAVWTTLNLIHGCMSDEACSRGRDLRFKLVSGTSTGAMVAIAVDRFNSARCASERSRRLDDIANWFTCFSIHDLYCVRSAPITNLFGSGSSAQRGVLEFDGIEKVLRSCVDADMLKNRSELVLNTVEFRSGRLFSLSDQYELDRPAAVVQAALASALLPVIGKPVVELPVGTPYDPRDPLRTEPAFLDGGIRSEIPVLPLARRGAERTLVVSSSASVLGETKRLENALALAARYIDVSTGGVTESELAHAKRHVESVRFAEIEACYDFLTHEGRSLCTSNGCDAHAVCEGSWAGVCGKPSGPRIAPGAPGARLADGRDTRSLSLRTEPFWQLEGVFRDEGTVDALNGYDFDPVELRRLFQAGAEVARRRCFDIAKLLGVVADVPPMGDPLRARIVAWCSPHLVNVCPSQAKEGDKELRLCGEPAPDKLDACRGRQVDACGVDGKTR